MKVLVCGGRDFCDLSMLVLELDMINMSADPITMLIHGDAAGADRLSGDWAVARGVPVKAVPARWKEHGRAAGPIRNGEMLKLLPDLVVAFPGGRGTENMISQAERAGVRVLRVGQPATR